MATNRWPAAAGFVLAATLGAVHGADLCEGCWEVSGRGSLLISSGDAAEDCAAGLGAGGAFRFRPYWGVEFSLDRHPGSIPDGPDETVTFLSVSFAYTFRAVRDQRTRPYAFLVLGYAWDQVGPYHRSISTPGGSLVASSPPATDAGPLWGLGVGGSTSLGARTFLRYELRGLDWSSFGQGRQGAAVSVGVAVRLGR